MCVRLHNHMKKKTQMVVLLALGKIAGYLAGVFLVSSLPKNLLNNGIFFETDLQQSYHYLAKEIRCLCQVSLLRKYCYCELVI